MLLRPHTLIHELKVQTKGPRVLLEDLVCRPVIIGLSIVEWVHISESYVGLR